MEEIINAAKDKFNELTQVASSLFQKEVLDPVKEYSIEKINDAWTEINNATDVLMKTGYSVTDIAISMSVPPSMSLSFNRVEDIGDEIEEQLLQENKDKTYLYALLLALFKANALQKNINAGTYAFTGLQVTMGLSIPTIDMMFKKI